MKMPSSFTTLWRRRVFAEARGSSTVPCATAARPACPFAYWRENFGPRNGCGASPPSPQHLEVSERPPIATAEQFRLFRHGICRGDTRTAA